MVATYKWKLGTFKTKKQAFHTCFWEGKIQMFSCSAELHIVHRVILRPFDESHGLAVVRLDVPNWRQRFWKSLVTFIIACAALFHNSKLNVPQCLKSFSACLISVARGCSPVQATSPSKHTSKPLCGGTARHRVWVCVCVCVGGLTFHFNTKWKAAYQMAQLGLTHGRAAEPGATRGWPWLWPGAPWQPTGLTPHNDNIMCFMKHCYHHHHHHLH